jgi:hypothetical protein
MPKRGEYIEFICKSCGNREMRPKHCPYTGILHGRGFQYTCKCRGALEVKPNNDPYRFKSECEKTLDAISIQENKAG